jgi:3-oxoacyl-[acyl-carrier protein] reductase
VLLQSSRTVVVTGSSSGLGQAIAEAFAEHGDSLVVHGHRNQAGLDETVRRVLKTGQACHAIKADLMLDADIERLVLEAFAWRGRVDVWINMAGADVLTGDARHWSFQEKLDRLWQVDVRGTIRLSRLVAEQMLVQEKRDRLPSIVNVSWDQAEAGMDGDSGQYFSATKAAVAAFTKSLAKTFAPNLRVNCLAPGWIQTAWGNSASEAWDERAKSESLLHRWGQAQDIANAALWLSAPESEFINGQTIAVNGGRK